MFLLVAAGVLAGVFLYLQLPTQLLLTEDIQELQEWLREKERINEHIVKVCEKHGQTAREEFK